MEEPPLQGSSDKPPASDDKPLYLHSGFQQLNNANEEEAGGQWDQQLNHAPSGVVNDEEAEKTEDLGDRDTQDQVFSRSRSGDLEKTGRAEKSGVNDEEAEKNDQTHPSTPLDTNVEHEREREKEQVVAGGKEQVVAGEKEMLGKESEEPEIEGDHIRSRSNTSTPDVPPRSQLESSTPAPVDDENMNTLPSNQSNPTPSKEPTNAAAAAAARVVHDIHSPPSAVPAAATATATATAPATAATAAAAPAVSALPSSSPSEDGKPTHEIAIDKKPTIKQIREEMEALNNFWLEKANTYTPLPMNFLTLQEQSELAGKNREEWSREDKDNFDAVPENLRSLAYVPPLPASIPAPLGNTSALSLAQARNILGGPPADSSCAPSHGSSKRSKKSRSTSSSSLKVTPCAIPQMRLKSALTILTSQLRGPIISST